MIIPPCFDGISLRIIEVCNFIEYSRLWVCSYLPLAMSPTSREAFCIRCRTGSLSCLPWTRGMSRLSWNFLYYYTGFQRKTYNFAAIPAKIGGTRWKTSNSSIWVSLVCTTFAGQLGNVIWSNIYLPSFLHYVWCLAASIPSIGKRWQRLNL